MNIESPDPRRTVQDYDFLTVQGLLLPITIDKFYGDNITLTDDVIEVKLGPRPSLSDPKDKTPEETILIFKTHLVSITHREREFTDFTDDQRAEWAEEYANPERKTVQ